MSVLVYHLKSDFLTELKKLIKMGKSGNGKDVRYHRVDLMSKKAAANNGAKHFSIADDDDDSDSELVRTTN